MIFFPLKLTCAVQFVHNLLELPNDLLKFREDSKQKFNIRRYHNDQNRYI